MTEITVIKEHITIPNNVKIAITNKTVTVTGEKGTHAKHLEHPEIDIKLKDNIANITCILSSTKKNKALVGTFTAHITNMITGVTQGFEYKMKTVFSHFPIKTSVEGSEFIIQNFLGERSPRRAKILDGVKVEANGEDITVSGIDKEKVGQTAANIERAARVKRRDARVFQDGVYVTSKGR
jgi:large subunit ribosomal protein L6